MLLVNESKSDNMIPINCNQTLVGPAFFFVYQKKTCNLHFGRFTVILSIEIVMIGKTAFCPTS